MCIMHKKSFEYLHIISNWKIQNRAIMSPKMADL